MATTVHPVSPTARETGINGDVIHEVVVPDADLATVGTVRHPTLLDAAEKARAMASRWGGDWVVFANAGAQDGNAFFVRGEAYHAADKTRDAGYVEVGCVRSHSADRGLKLRWEWADGRADAAPYTAREAERLAQAGAVRPASVPPVGTEALADLCWRVTCAQRALQGHRLREAEGLSTADDCPLKPAL